MARSVNRRAALSAATRPVIFYEKAGGVSWQARLLSRFLRYVIKQRIQKNGISPATTRYVIGVLEWLPRRFGDFATVRTKDVAGVRCDVVYPLNPPPKERVVLYLHGGGFFAHLPHSYKQFARRLAEALGATVYMPAYRLAPEHRYPAATDDCLAVYAALLEDGCDAHTMAVMGDSAGGNLALVTLLRARDEGMPLPCCSIVISPGADLTFSGASFSSNAEADPLVPLHALHQVSHQYVNADQTGHPYVSPMLGDYTGLPPLKIIVGSTEVLLDSSVQTADASRAAGVAVDLQVWRDMPHVFPMLAYLPEAQIAMQQMTSFFNRYARHQHALPGSVLPIHAQASLHTSGEHP